MLLGTDGGMLAPPGEYISDMPTLEAAEEYEDVGIGGGTADEECTAWLCEKLRVNGLPGIGGGMAACLGDVMLLLRPWNRGITGGLAASETGDCAGSPSYIGSARLV